MQYLILCQVAVQPNTRGTVLLAIYGVVALGVAAAAAAATHYLVAKASESKRWAVVQHFWVLSQTIGEQVAQQMRPGIEQALADGKVTAEEWAHLKSEAVAAVKTAAGDKWMQELQWALGDGAVTQFLAGLVSKALKANAVSSPIAIGPPLEAAPTPPSPLVPAS